MSDGDDISLPNITAEEFSKLSKLPLQEKAIYLLRKRVKELEQEVSLFKKKLKEEKDQVDWWADQARKSLKSATPLWRRVHPEAKDTDPGVSTVVDWLIDERKRLIKENKDYADALGLNLKGRTLVGRRGRKTSK